MNERRGERKEDDAIPGAVSVMNHVGPSNGDGVVSSFFLGKHAIWEYQYQYHFK
jgi:hypothetical protein